MNLWTRFNALAPGSPRHVGEVTAVGTYPYCTVVLIPSGVSIVVAGPGRTLTVGQRWLIEDGRIIEEGPTGTVLEAEV